MRYGNGRILLFNRNGRPLGDLAPRDVLSAPRMVEELNGEHTLAFETRRRLEPETRLLWRDGMGTWHEWVIQEPKEHHRRGEYFAVWSLQHDLEGTSGTVHWASAEVGTHDPIDAETALTIALSDQRRWQVGVVDVDSRAGASMYDAQVWSYVKTVARVWGGELSVTIEVDNTHVISRKVNLLAHVGSETATRRFDWGHDVEDITRTPDPAPYYCRIRPRGGSAKTDNDGIDYSDRCGIEEVEPSGHDYIEDAESAAIFRVLNPDGTYHYPMKTVIYEVTETSTGPDDEELYEKALADLHNHTRPRVTYEASVRQFARAGLDYRGVTLGDEIQIVDRGFSDEGSLRLSGRIIRIEQDLPVFGGNPDNTELTIGFLQKSIGETLRDIVSEATTSVTQRLNKVTEKALVYLNDLIDQLNAEINATGGWFYVVPGIGAVTYDHVVTDPSVGTEAGQVTEMRGGAIRFADSRDASGNWNWRTLITSGHIAADFITTVNITAGRIESADGHSVVIDLDNNEFRFGDKTSVDIATGLDAALTDSETEWIQTTSQTVPPSQDAQGWSATPPTYESGRYIWERTVVTHGDGTTTRTDPVMISGRDGQDGAPGTPGAAGTSVTISRIEYGTSTSADATPTSWSTTSPASIPKGRWLWVKTTYSDSTTTTAKSYVGTDGRDGTSVSIQNTEKYDGTTTITLIDGSGSPITITIEDGEDGAQGQRGPTGADGKDSYIHIAWATSADGTQGFSTTESANKTYIGVYHDNTASDSTRPADYSWSLIKGADGADGLNQATILLYQRKATKPAKPSVSTTYTFATKTLSGSYSPWSTEIPDADGNPCWVTAATASSNGATDTIPASEWADVTKLVEDGGDGTDGLNQATIYLYSRGGEWRYIGESLVARGVAPFAYDAENLSFDFAANGESVTLVDYTPTRPTANCAYTFATGDLSPVPTGWSRTIPDGEGTVWVISAVAISNGATDTIAPSEWSDVAKLAEDGAGITVGTVQYATGASGTEAPAAGWQDAIPDTSPGQWLWVRTIYSDGTSSDTCSYMGTDGLDGTSVSIQSSSKSGGVTTVVLTDSDGTTKTLEIADGEDGNNGTPGANGYVHVAWALSSDGSQGFSTSASANKTYIGVYTDHTEADSQDYHDYSWSLIKGADGTSVTVSTVATSYASSASGTVIPNTGWQSSIPTVEPGKYLWTRVTVTYSDGNTATSHSAARQGADGADGTDGTSPTVTSTAIEYQQSTSGTITPSGAWSSTPPAATAGQYMWTRTTITYSDSAQSISYSVAYNGKDGTAAYTYSINSSPAALVRAESGTLTPAQITFSATRAQGTGNPSAYSGRFVISEYDGTSWADKYTSSSNESSKSYSPTATAKVVRCNLYLAGGTTTLLDTQTAPIVSNGATGAKGDKGDAGDDGLNHATVYLFKRTDAWTYDNEAESLTAPNGAMTANGENLTLPFAVEDEKIILSELPAPAKPSATTTYAFATAALTGDLSGWSRTIPDGDGTVWVTTADAVSSDATVAISPSSWATPSRLAMAGTAGVGVAGIDVAYGISGNPDAMPSSWQSMPPFLMPGEWLWVRTTYTATDGTETSSVSKSYVGTDGADGTSVYVKSSTKQDGTTTIVLADSDGNESTLQIVDGEDGDNGTPGKSGYVHVAWAMSADGSQGFSTSVSANKTHIGVYTDNTEADSQDYHAYSWSLIKGADGTSVTVSKIEYGTSNSASTAPTSYSTTTPTSIAKGKWLWTKTTYSDNSTATNKSYVGTDGQDGTSVYVTSTSKSGKTTTVDLSDGTTLTISDGEDGPEGTAGKNGYVHTAWANSANGQTDFSTTTSANKKYLGVYTDNTATDSANPSDYSWSLIKGDKGDTGSKGDTGADAYTVLLTNEAHTFAASTAAAVAGSATSQVIAYKGTTQVAANIGTITGAPTGMTVTLSNNGKTTAGFTVTVTTSLTTRQGVLNVPVTVDGKSFTLKFSWALALAGAKGDAGADGLNQATVYLYARTGLWSYSQANERLTAPPGAVTASGENLSFDFSVSSENVTLSEQAAPAKPSANTTYTFSTSTLSGSFSPWAQDIPDGEGTVWVTTARAASDAATDTIAPSEWSAPARLAVAGKAGMGISRTAISYGISASSATQPTTWQDTMPFAIPGQWMWMRMVYTYTDGTTDTAYSQSYMGTDGEDGVGVIVQDVTRTGKQLTITMVDSTGQPTTVTLNDGEDGEVGQKGANGYVHIAWANSANGATDFSTSVSSGKKYMGVYTDDKSADSQHYTDYSWTLIRGADGQNGAKGDTGKGVSAVVPEYYLSTSKTSCTGGSWLTTPAEYVAGRYYWTRDVITWTDGNSTTTTAVLDNALNGAYEEAAAAAKVATNYISFSEQTGLDVGYTNTSAKTRISGSGVEIFDGDANSAIYAGLQNSTSIVRVGKADGGNTSMRPNEVSMRDAKVSVFTMTTEGSYGVTYGVIDVFYVSSASSSSPETLRLSYAPSSITSVKWKKDGDHSGGGSWSDYSGGSISSSEYSLSSSISDDSTISGAYKNLTISPSTAVTYAYVSVAYNITLAKWPRLMFGQGSRAVRPYSMAMGLGCIAHGPASVAMGMACYTGQSLTASDTCMGESAAIGRLAIADPGYAFGNNVLAAGSGAVALGILTKALGEGSMACGCGGIAKAPYSFVAGYRCFSGYSYQSVFGQYNASSSSVGAFIVGKGTSDASRSNSMVLSGSGNLWIAGSLTQNSDRRLKEHVAYLGNDAADFVRALRPALFVKDGERHTGFYAQDVEEAEPDEWDTSTVKPEHSDESLDFDPLTLDYTALIAPLVAYAQALEKRVDEQQRTIDQLIGRIEALEGRI